MHNDTPLGTTMRLKELDRQAMMDRHRSRLGTQDAFRVAAVWAATTALLRRLTVGTAPRRVASRG